MTHISLLGLCFYFATGAAYAFPKCEVKMRNAAQYTFANEQGKSIQTTNVAEFLPGPWTSAIGNNTGSAEVIVYSTNKSYEVYYVFAQQIGNSNDCTISSVKPSNNGLSDIRAQSLRYKLAIRDAVFVSEGDAEWDMFYTSNTVSDRFTKAELSQALETSEPIEIYTEAEALEILTGYTSREDAPFPEQAYLYQNLIKEFKKDFKSLRAVKVGQPDSGSLRLYLFGRLPDGRLVGLSTISVET